MILNRLPQNVEAEVFKLIGDAQFQKIYSEDKTLDYLQAQKHNKDIQFQQLQLLLNKKNYVKIIGKNNIVQNKNIFKKLIEKLFKKSSKPIEGMFFEPITLALYSYLYTIKSNLIFDINKIDLIDLDIFFYLLQTKDYSYDWKSVLFKSSDYCNKVLKLTPSQIVAIFNRIYSIQFKVFSFFPRISDESSEPSFNVDWMLGILSKIKSYVSYTTEELYTRVSIMEIYYWYIQFCKNNGDKNIFIRNEQEILDEIDNRIIDLVIQRLMQKKIIKRDQHQYYFDLMKYTKEKDNG